MCQLCSQTPSQHGARCTDVFARAAKTVFPISVQGYISREALVHPVAILRVPLGYTVHVPGLTRCSALFIYTENRQGEGL